MDDPPTRIEYCCRKCGKVFVNLKWKTAHELKCNGVRYYQIGEIGTENVDFVICRLCGKKARTLSKHLTQVHYLTQKDYIEQFPSALITCSSSAKTFKSRGKNFAWLQRAIERGDDLTEYKMKMGSAVSKSIMSNPVERVRRAKQLAMNNRTPEAREKSRIVAKKTSARPEIQQARTEALAHWRDTHFDEFYEKCIKAMLSYKTSKPELWVRTYVQQQYPHLGFKGNQRLYDKERFLINKSHKRQVDILSKSHKIIIEIDGYLHFKNVPQWNQLQRVIEKDKELNLNAPLMSYKLIRISYDQWNNTGVLNTECIDTLNTLLSNDNLNPGLYTIGNLYNTI